MKRSYAGVMIRITFKVLHELQQPLMIMSYPAVLVRLCNIRFLKKLLNGVQKAYKLCLFQLMQHLLSLCVINFAEIFLKRLKAYRIPSKFC